mgnify:FL=1
MRFSTAYVLVVENRRALLDDVNRNCGYSAVPYSCTELEPEEFYSFFLIFSYLLYLGHEISSTLKLCLHLLMQRKQCLLYAIFPFSVLKNAISFLTLSTPFFSEKKCRIFGSFSLYNRFLFLNGIPCSISF